ncbi:MAG: hypothetical protein IT489_02595 [Gammaproteobacteria bacterium]|nr:hypothetical protein [Gammaproteobacteria bacterium]
MALFGGKKKSALKNLRHSMAFARPACRAVVQISSPDRCKKTPENSI